MNELGHVLWLGFLGVALVVEVVALLAAAIISAGSVVKWWTKQ